ncbi:MAG TPA: hypothetical protein VKC99_07100, partial [Methyloceanibacter sp.]|nr:hypothetical protein [Methyloceanibacter sp.]
MDPKPEHNTAPKVINGRINGRFAPGYSGNPGGSPEATRRAFNKRFLLDLAEDWQQHGREVFKRVRRESPASYLKVCAMLVPKELKFEHSGGVKAMTDEQLERSIELIKELIAQRDAAANAKVIEGAEMSPPPHVDIARLFIPLAFLPTSQPTSRRKRARSSAAEDSARAPGAAR